MNRTVHRRQLLAAAVLAAALPWARAASPKPRLEVWKSPTCGCCGDWVEIMAKEGFEVTVQDKGNTAARQRAGIPLTLGSCHTAFVGGYAIEGHVPPADVKRLLAERPDAIGLTVPGMPIGSPGMDGPAYGGRLDPYQVLLISRDGSTSVWQSYR